MRTLALSLLAVAACGGATYVANTPRTLLVEEAYATGGVRDAVARAFHHRRIVARREVPGQIAGDSERSAVPCSFTVTYTPQNVDIASAGPGPDPSKIDARCAEEADLLGKAIQREVERPSKLAKKEERLARRREEAVARDNAWAAQANLQAEQLAAQQQAAAAMQQPPADDGTDAPPPDPQYAPPPAPAPSVSYSYSSTNVQAQTNVQSQTTVNNYAPAPTGNAPRIKPNTCCVQGNAFVCPDTMTYAAACVQHRADVTRVCRYEQVQSQFCPR